MDGGATIDQARRRRVSTRIGMVSTAYENVSVSSAAMDGTWPNRAPQDISVSATVLTAYARNTKLSQSGGTADYSATEEPSARRRRQEAERAVYRRGEKCVRFMAGEVADGKRRLADQIPDEVKDSRQLRDSIVHAPARPGRAAFRRAPRP